MQMRLFNLLNRFLIVLLLKSRQKLVITTKIYLEKYKTQLITFIHFFRWYIMKIKLSP